MSQAAIAYTIHTCMHRTRPLGTRPNSANDARLRALARTESSAANMSRRASDLQRGMLAPQREPSCAGFAISDTFDTLSHR